jgi:hypothetical protein
VETAGGYQNDRQKPPLLRIIRDEPKSVGPTDCKIRIPQNSGGTEGKLRKISYFI